MRWTIAVRALIAASALAVAASLVHAERQRDECDRASKAVFLASAGPAHLLREPVDWAVAECAGSDPLARLAVGMQRANPGVATRLASEAARREPESYLAWSVLATSAKPADAQVAARRARELNPLSVSAAGP